MMTMDNRNRQTDLQKLSLTVVKAALAGTLPYDFNEGGDCLNLWVGDAIGFNRPDKGLTMEQSGSKDVLDAWLAWETYVADLLTDVESFVKNAVEGYVCGDCGKELDR